MAIELTDKVALVTGGAQGIGFGIARSFLETEARVVIADRNDDALTRATAELKARFGAKAHGILADIAREEDVSLIILGRPANTESVFQLTALQTFAAEVERETGVETRII